MLDSTAVVFFPLEDFFDELFPAQVMSGHVVVEFEGFLDDCLRRDSGVVTSWDPDGAFSFHSVPSGDTILNRICQRMP